MPKLTYNLTQKQMDDIRPNLGGFNSVLGLNDMKAELNENSLIITTSAEQDLKSIEVKSGKLGTTAKQQTQRILTALGEDYKEKGSVGVSFSLKKGKAQQEVRESSKPSPQLQKQARETVRPERASLSVRSSGTGSLTTPQTLLVRTKKTTDKGQGRG